MEETKKYKTPDYTRNAIKAYKERNKEKIAQQAKERSQTPEFKEKKRIYMRQYMAERKKKEQQTTSEEITLPQQTSSEESNECL